MGGKGEVTGENGEKIWDTPIVTDLTVTTVTVLLKGFQQREKKKNRERVLMCGERNPVGIGKRESTKEHQARQRTNLFSSGNRKAVREPGTEKRKKGSAR